MTGWKFQEDYWKDSLPWVTILENIKRKPDKPDLSKVFSNHPIHQAFVISVVVHLLVYLQDIQVSGLRQ